VDAAVGGGPPGEVRLLWPEGFQRAEGGPVSSHGIGLVEAVELARCLYPGGVAEEIRVLAVSIARPDPRRTPERAQATGLSAEVAAAVPRAVDRALAWIEEGSHA
jgi:hydrogenase maturation protease